MKYHSPFLAKISHGTKNTRPQKPARGHVHPMVAGHSVPHAGENDSGPYFPLKKRHPEGCQFNTCAFAVRSRSLPCLPYNNACNMPPSHRQTPHSDPDWCCGMSPERSLPMPAEPRRSVFALWRSRPGFDATLFSSVGMFSCLDITY